MKNSENPIGIFDSGIGGLTVANAVLKALPNEHLVYFGDTAHLPYGDKSPETIKRFSSVITDFLLKKDVKLIIIACNSASSVAFEHVQELAAQHQITVVNVIDPVVRYITQNKYQKVGIIGTRATIGSQIFPQKIQLKNSQIQVHSLATPLLAPMIESGFVKGNISSAVVENYLNDPVLQDIDALVLACTHYPLIKKEIQQYYQNTGRKVEILATNEIVADYVKKVLEANKLVASQSHGEHHFFVSDYTDTFAETTRLFYKEEVDLQYSPIFASDKESSQ